MKRILLSLCLTLSLACGCATGPRPIIGNVSPVSDPASGITIHAGYSRRILQAREPDSDVLWTVDIERRLGRTGNDIRVQRMQIENNRVLVMLDTAELLWIDIKTGLITQQP